MKKQIFEVKIKQQGERLQNFAHYCETHDIEWTLLNYSPVSFQDFVSDLKSYVFGVCCGIIIGYFVMYATLH